ncbi:helix-turn-helix transcriptional regulator [Pedobacter sp. BS3]|uniref:helix-turn-helix transcriptional regulator n=1 Tax=Pedobacter sp. BS3 TaxID=2567937 RepID=UPI0011EFBE28|nr:AraC family transcriptional regulator [Pedobacter sp. BS3]TZF83143.1 helix-turn-helix transcriptional regulator [Pedobacter sp. BS3]
MGMNIRDNSGIWQEIGASFDLFLMQAPLVAERREKYSFSFGDAELVQISMPDIFIVYGDILFKHSQLHFRSTDIPDMVELHFALSGNGTMYNYIDQRRYFFEPNQHNIIYTPELDGVGEYDTKCNYRFFEVHFTKERFLQLAKDSCKALQEFAEHVASGRYTQIAERSLPVSLVMHNCIRDIMNCDHTAGLKLLFLQAKCIELLVLQAEAFEKAVSRKQSRILKSAYDRDCIFYARDYLLQHIHQPPSIAQLAKVCGINEFKLKQGFKEVFDSSIYGYLNNHKLDHAKDLLLAGKPIKSVAAELGYSSVQHFNTAFRKKFAVSPGKVKS